MGKEETVITIPSEKKEKEGLSPPPSYTELPPAPDLSERLGQLDLTPSKKLPSADECIAHLKFLEALYQLREDVTGNEELFDIGKSIDEGLAEQERQERETHVKEKRWAVFVERAVDRFTAWWSAWAQTTTGGRPSKPMTVYNLRHLANVQNIALDSNYGMTWEKEQLPPLDVLMVWHSYMLNPRCYFEDCLRLGKLDFWATPFPWLEIDSGIDNVTFEYNGTPKAQSKFEASTGKRWNNFDDPMVKTLNCPGCGVQMTVPWTSGSGYLSGTSSFQAGHGYADSEFKAKCSGCNLEVTHDELRVLKFKDDLRLLMGSDVPMPGTLIGSDGKPKAFLSGTTNDYGPLFPSLLMKRDTGRTLIGLRSVPGVPLTIAKFRDIIEPAMKDGKLVRGAKIWTARLQKEERRAVRRMLSCYWYNSSPFSLDLVGAVIRQGTFVGKMHNIDWLHSPALSNTMTRLLTKYKRFFTIMAENSSRIVVPTLDVDLAWHTHQLSPQRYAGLSISMTKKFIDHDDKIEESALSEAFTWTSKAYQSRFGEPYSECTCWYCEAVRESHTSSLDRVFRPSKHGALNKLRDEKADAPAADPHAGPHISAHAAVHDTSPEALARARVHSAELDASYRKACARARKKGHPEPKRDDYYIYGPYGGALLYAPYMVAAPVYWAGGAGVYAAGNPSCVDGGAGAYGACAAGSCGAGGPASGGCGGGCGSGGCGGGGCGGGGCGGGS